MLQAIFFSFVSLFVSAAIALPLPKAGLRTMRTDALPKTFTSDYDFEGIVALGNCSGSLIRFENSRDTDRAMMMTNGHCIETGFPAPGTYLYGKASSRRVNILNPDASLAGVTYADMIIYGTMTKTDMAIYRLHATYADIKRDYDIRPLTLSSRRAQEGNGMEVISGYWRKGYRCQVERFITHLKEGRWTWDDSIRYSRPGCEVIGGTSGSPIVAVGTRIAIGVNNTGNEDGEACTDNNPCEVDENGDVSYTKGFSYGQQSYWVYSCLNSNNEIDLSVSGCQLFH